MTELPSIPETLAFLENVGASPYIVFHSIQVARKAKEIANILIIKGFEVDVDLVYIGGLVHDIGRSQVYGIRHGYVGGEIIRKHLQHENLARIAERHVGAGISKDETQQVGLPLQSFIPTTINEKVVCIADKFFHYRFGRNYQIIGWNETNNTEEEVAKLSFKLGSQHPVIQRLKKLEEEFREMMGKDFPSLSRSMTY